jgi:hypothetical protein
MNLSVLLGIICATAVALERLVEIIKPFYLQIKSYFMGKVFPECSANEKKFMTILLGPVMCIIAQIGIDIPSVNESAVIQYVLAGLVASLGSNVLHSLLNIILAIAKSSENIKNGNVE